MKERVKLQRARQGQLWLRGTAPCQAAGTHPLRRVRLSAPHPKSLETRQFFHFFWYFGTSVHSSPSPGHGVTGSRRRTGGGQGRLLPSSSSSQSLTGQPFLLLPPCSPWGLAPLFKRENPPCSFPSRFVGDV